VSRRGKLALAGAVLAVALAAASLHSRVLGALIVRIVAPSATMECPPPCHLVCEELAPVAGGLWRRCAVVDCVEAAGYPCRAFPQNL
jgi:hypothetical protein